MPEQSTLKSRYPQQVWRAAAAQAQQHQSIIPQHGYYSAPSFGALGPPVSTVSSMLSTLSAIPERTHLHLHLTARLFLEMDGAHFLRPIVRPLAAPRSSQLSGSFEMISAFRGGFAAASVLFGSAGTRKLQAHGASTRLSTKE